MNSPLAAALRDMPILAGLEPALVEQIAAEVELIDLGGGETLFRQGDRGDSLFFVLSGRLRVLDSSEHGREDLAEIAAGESVGEMAALTGDARSATVVAIRNCRLARLDRARLNRLLASHPELLSRITLLLARRLGRSGRIAPARKQASSFTLLQASETIALPAVGAKLAAAMRRFATVAIVDGRSPPPGLDPTEIGWRSRFADAASAIEARHD